ncbi:CBF-domain-containing protein [Artomyces pyxidatus]|uniref:CBF-domain-containing protein n=1 Tax=Artomyces pyxidatus TaxID=48021 RepID=A0ACB8TGJ8_9AGAM|nr:CBF-domain-containing protein [Artomyces pyxidatus]
MARLRKEKGEKAKVTEVTSKPTPKFVTDKPAGAPKPHKTKRKSSAGATDVLKAQVLALGGDEKDLELLNGIHDGEVVQGAGDGKEEKILSKEIANVLKGLRQPQGQDVAPAHRESTKNVKKDKSAKSESKKPSNASHKREKASSPPKPTTDEKKPELLPPTSSVGPAIHPNSKSLKVPAAHDWYNFVPPLAPVSSLPSPTAAQIYALSTRASDLHTAEVSHFTSGPNTSLVSSSSDQAFLKNILASGTLSDRLSALTLMVQSSPLHNTRALEVLKGMAEKGKGGGPTPKDGDKGKGRAGGREERLKAARAIVDWWVGGGIPGRKLKHFRDQPLLHPSVTDQHLLLWYFEDWLKKFFFSFLQILEARIFSLLSMDSALSFIFTLLRETPEQEHNLLRLLVNKLGDTEKSIGSRASYHILQLLQSHPAMKFIVIREITALIMRPASSSLPSSSLSSQPDASGPKMHIKFTNSESDKKKTGSAKPQEKSAWNTHARYYAAITFNQIVLSTSEEDRKAARSLMDVYFKLFREVVGERSVPDAAEPDLTEPPEGEHKGKGKFRGKSLSDGRSAKGKAKEVQGAAGFAEVQDESSRLVSAILSGVNRAMPFARFGGEDVEFNRHMDTLFLIVHTSTFNITLQALTLINHVVNSASPTAHPDPSSSSSIAVAARYYRTLYATLLDPRLFSSNKQAMYLNLLFKSLKHDTDLERVNAFVKRFCQVLAGGFGGTEFVAGGLWLLGEVSMLVLSLHRLGEFDCHPLLQLFDTVPGLKSMVTKHPQPASDDDDGKGDYDPRKRDPQYAHASTTPLWELVWRSNFFSESPVDDQRLLQTPLLNHAHPTMSLLARQLLSRQPLTTSPDLSLHTLSHFLDRFVYKNPKKIKAKGASMMQPTSADGDGVRKLKGDIQEGPVNEEGWWKKSKGSVPVDQVFFQKYFSQKHEKDTAKATKVDKRKPKRDHSDNEAESDADEVREDVDDDADDDSEEEEENSDAEEAEIWKAMKASMPDLTGANDDDMDSDDLPSGLDDSDDPVEASADAEEYDDSDEEDESEKLPSDDGEDAFSMVEASDAEDLLDLDADMPDGLVDYDGPEGDGEEEWSGFGGEPAKKRKHEGEEKGKAKRKKLRSLPTFASYDDYAKMIEDGPEDNI